MKQPKHLVLAADVSRVIGEAIASSHLIAETLIDRPRHDVPLSHPTMALAVVVDEIGRPSASVTLYDRSDEAVIVSDAAYTFEVDTALGRVATVLDVVQILGSDLWSHAACSNRQMIKAMIRDARAVAAAA